jgi:hypothetical protein
LIYCGGGVHLNEGLGLKTIDCDPTGSDKKLIVQRQPDDRDDPRLKPALAKTLLHPVPIDDHLAHVLHGFIVNHPEGDLDLLSSADRRHGAMEEPGSKHSISETPPIRPACWRSLSPMTMRSSRLSTNCSIVFLSRRALLRQRSQVGILRCMIGPALGG